MLTRLGVIGCGGHAVSSHIRAGQEVGFRLAAAYDPSPESIGNAVAASGGAPVATFPSAEELIATAEIDALLITSPDEFHAAQLLAAVKRGIAVLVDKPLATTVADLRIVREALDLAARDRVAVTSCHPRRFDRPYVWVVDHLPGLALRFGALERVELDFSYHAPSAAWKQTRSLLLDHFCHEIDYLRLLLGDRPFEARRLVDSFDRYSVAGVHGGAEDRVVFLFSGTRCLHARSFPEEIRLRFARGACSVDTSTGVATLHDHESGGRYHEVTGPTDHGLRALGVTRDFAHAVAGGRCYLTHTDLMVNTESGIALAGPGRYVYAPH